MNTNVGLSLLPFFMNSKYWWGATLWSPGYSLRCPGCQKWSFGKASGFRVFWRFHRTLCFCSISSRLDQGSTECRPTLTGSRSVFGGVPHPQSTESFNAPVISER